VVGVHIDISERKEFEDAAHDSEERFEDSPARARWGVRFQFCRRAPLDFTGLENACSAMPRRT